MYATLNGPYPVTQCVMTARARSEAHYPSVVQEVARHSPAVEEVQKVLDQFKVAEAIGTPRSSRGIRAADVYYGARSGHHEKQNRATPSVANCDMATTKSSNSIARTPRSGSVTGLMSGLKATNVLRCREQRGALVVMPYSIISLANART